MKIDLIAYSFRGLSVVALSDQNSWWVESRSLIIWLVTNNLRWLHIIKCFTPVPKSDLRWFITLRKKNSSPTFHSPKSNESPKTLVNVCKCFWKIVPFSDISSAKTLAHKKKPYINRAHDALLFYQRIFFLSSFVCCLLLQFSPCFRQFTVVFHIWVSESQLK